MRRLTMAFFEFGSNFMEGLSEEALDEVLKLIDDTAAKLEEINRKLKEKQQGG